MVNNCKILLIFAACLISVRSETFTYQQAIKECDALNLKIQKPEADGRVQTLNKKGAVTARFAYIEREFLKFGKGKEILEIGGVLRRCNAACPKAKYDYSIRTQ